jgi:hypothetical protein
MSTATIPITISPDAAAYVAEIGMQQPCRQMLEHIQETVPGLRAISVVLQESNDMGPDPCVIFDVTMADPKLEKDETEGRFERWQIENFPTEDYIHFVMLTVYG